jgi:phosphinothricin acetyltransferase
MTSIRDAIPSDAEVICAIYNHHVRNTIVTFEEVEISAQEMQGRIASVTSILPWLVIERDANVVGYAYATKHRERSAYRFAVETTVYVAEQSYRQGLGTMLYGALLERLRKLPVHTALGGIALPNPASVAVHEKCGFTKVAHFLEVGFKFGRWIDVGYWQVLL